MNARGDVLYPPPPMIPRYSRQEMAALWSPENRLRIWLEIETLALEGMANIGVVPKEAVRAVRAKGNFKVDRIDTLEKELKHDVIAFLTNVAEYVGPEARYLHKGMTSSDVLDTCLAIQLNQASQILLEDIDRLLSSLKLRAHEHKMTVCMGRSHGIHAEPITFGLKLALWYDEMRRNRGRLEEARQQIAVGKISGAVGTFAHIDPSVEAHVCSKLQLTPARLSTQIIQRDRHAHFFSILAVIASSIDKMATEIRHLQRTEVYEAEEAFGAGQKGSSAMPHKRNPVLSENLSGLARLLRGYALTSLENVALWHERDISHSSAERVMAPDATIALDFMLHRLSQVIANLVVYPDRMRKNIDQMKGLMYSQRVLLALTEKGLSRERAYHLVQRCAMRVWHEGVDFKQELKKDAELERCLEPGDLDSLFDEAYFLKHIDTLFERVFCEDQ